MTRLGGLSEIGRAHSFKQDFRIYLYLIISGLLLQNHLLGVDICSWIYSFGQIGNDNNIVSNTMLGLPFLMIFSCMGHNYIMTLDCYHDQWIQNIIGNIRAWPWNIWYQYPVYHWSRVPYLVNTDHKAKSIHEIRPADHTITRGAPILKQKKS